ncbi:MAG: arsenosugar biosynthesis radical SAM (seleno)protein ArsS [Burkholderiales bacterium]
MHATLPLLDKRGFPEVRRAVLDTLQVNLGYRCNQTCLHCHVNAGPTRTEMMDDATVADVLAYLRAAPVRVLDVTGGAPELHPRFRELVIAARKEGVRVIDRCNLTILEEPGHEDLAEFLAREGVEITASLPCYTEELVDRQRGKGVYEQSVQALRRLNALGYGAPDGKLILNLVYNPQGPSLPPPQAALEADYHRELGERHGIQFNHLFALANLPIARFGSTLISKGQFNGYMKLLRDSFRAENLETLMCRNLISVDWQGWVYDCDFNQMLGLPLQIEGKPRQKLRDLIGRNLQDNAIVVRDHCYGCSAGQGSSCGGALQS